MIELPADLLTALPDGAEPIAAQWWASLSEAEQQRVAVLWDERLEVRFFAPQTDDNGSRDDWDHVPMVSGGRFVPSDDDGRAEWSAGYFEHLLQHPELVLAYEPPTRTFHFGCTLHAEAQKCLADGYVATDYVCPISLVSCPLLMLRGARLESKKSESEKWLS